MAKALVLYHDNCPDGFTAAWAVWKALGDEAEYRAVNYGQPPLLVEAKGRRVILVDFSYPRPVLDAVAALATRVEVYDHHRTAEEDLRYWGDEAPETRHVVFDMKRSGASIAWDEFTIDKEALWLGVRPWLIAYVEDRDLWKWTLPDSREVSEYLFSFERTFAEWDRIAEEWGHTAGNRAERMAKAIESGRALLRAKRARVEKVCENVRWLMFHLPDAQDVGIPVVNTAWDFSEIGEHLCERFPGAVCGGYYFDRADKRQWGFRSRGDFDVSTLCKQYGGGGHKGAAGFTSAIGWLPS